MTGEDLSYTDDEGATLNGRWPVSEDDTKAGDVVAWPPFNPTTEGRLVALPTESVDDRDPHQSPPCAFCNHENNIEERRGWALEEAEGIQESSEIIMADDRKFMILADYALVDGSEILAFSCHSCIQGEPVWTCNDCEGNFREEDYDFDRDRCHKCSEADGGY